jgi:hypothetical protein
LRASRTKRALLLLRGSFVRELLLPFTPLVGLELEAYLMGDESPIFARDALGVRSPSVSAPLIDDGTLSFAPFVPFVPFAPFVPFRPVAGDDWKKRGDDAGGCDDRGPRRGVPVLPRIRREAGEDMIKSLCCMFKGSEA